MLYVSFLVCCDVCYRLFLLEFELCFCFFDYDRLKFLEIMNLSKIFFLLYSCGDYWSGIGGELDYSEFRNELLMKFKKYDNIMYFV